VAPAIGHGPSSAAFHWLPPVDARPADAEGLGFQHPLDAGASMRRAISTPHFVADTCEFDIRLLARGALAGRERDKP
jgi:hypothetical protein